jgi:hypothetical protein
MQRHSIRSRAGADGVLRVTLPLGKSEADREVRLIVEPVSSSLKSSEDYLDYLQATAGAWQGDFERPDQGEYEVRDSL